MPTKPNRAGKQQEYIPEGNGDASGEYSDGGGYNVHRPNPAKKEVPKENKPIPTIIDEEREKIKSMQQQYPTKAQNTARQLNERISFASKKYGEQMKSVIDNADEEMNDILLNTINNNEYDCRVSSKRSCMSNYVVFLNNDDFKTSRVEGEVYYHEHGHYVDKWAGEEKWLSSTYRNTSTGETLQEVLRREGTKQKAKEIYESFKERKTELEDESFKKAGTTREEYTNKQEEISKMMEDWKNEYGWNKKQTELVERRLIAESGIFSGKISFSQFEVEQEKVKQELADMLTDRDNKRKELESSGVGKWLEEKQQLIDDEKIKISDTLSKEYMTLSDMCGGITKGNGEFWGGHGKRYWRNPTAQAEEFFAEVYSARSVDKPLYEKIRQYFPESVKCFDEIINGIRRK